MNSTPRLRSAYPLTPRTGRLNGQEQAQNADHKASSSLDKTAYGPPDEGSGPLIPFSIVDAPTQRLYVSAFYLGLTAWRLYDYYGLTPEASDALPLFLKWILIDAMFLFGLPELKIPWLEWSSGTMAAIYLLHIGASAFLLFQIPLPFQTGLLAFARLMYDRELAVSERRVKPSSLLHKSSLILGKQIVHILPEGSATLNPEQKPFCVDSATTSTELPILINQTNPILLELTRWDLNTGANETTTISGREIKKLKRQADRGLPKKDASVPHLLKVPVKQTGLYRLTKVVDESNLEVQRTLSDTLIVWCPSAHIEDAHKDKCRGDLSNLSLEISGTPPLKVRYSRRVNSGDRSDVFLTVHPTDTDAHLAINQGHQSMVPWDSQSPNVSLARSHLATVPVNETLGAQGRWEYAIDEVHDALGNVVRYLAHAKGRAKELSKQQQIIEVHDTPTVLLDGCSPENPIKVAKGESALLPIWMNPSGSQETSTLSHDITYNFVPDSFDAPNSQSLIEVNTIRLINGIRGPKIQNPGQYSITSISNEFCKGQVIEPSSCLLINPAEPSLRIHRENIPHQCAGNFVGLHLRLDMTGTPPFYVSYTSRRDGGGISSHVEKFDSTTAQLELKPRESGHFEYEFLRISDAVYDDLSPSPESLKFDIDVKPTAWARFAQQSPHLDACIGEPVSLELDLFGQAPFLLEYDIVHGRSRDNRDTGKITDNSFTLKTPPLNAGGQHTVALKAVTDKSGCRITLEEDAKIQVRHQRPRAAFGLVESRQSLLTLEGKRAFLPLRLSGEPPYTVIYSLKHKEGTFRQTLQNANDELAVDSQDTYRLEEVWDKACPGSVDPNANLFEVVWVPRPTLQIVESNSLERSGDSFIKEAVCEGDQDSTDLAFNGNPPYHFEYEVRSEPDQGLPSVHQRIEDVALHGSSIKMDTSRAGLYYYKFSKLGDQSYDTRSVSSTPVTLRQRIYSRPHAKFTNTGKIYSYCKELTSFNDIVPISLSGKAPFTLELSIKHHSDTAAEIIKIPNIYTHDFGFQIPHRALTLGGHRLAIRKVRDANGCESSSESQASTVRVNVVDVPTILPLESNTDFCVGDRISFSLAGTPPFNIFYTFEGADKKASSPSTIFRRLAEKPGNFTVVAISDKASGDGCRARNNITKVIHPLPSVRMSKGRVSEVDIHEGGEAELAFEFEGTPPFEFTYTRSTTPSKGRKSVVLETKSDMSLDYTRSIKVSEEGTYEVVSIRDRYCGVTAQGFHDKSA